MVVPNDVQRLKSAIVAAGSVGTKFIPEYEIWAGILAIGTDAD